MSYTGLVPPGMYIDKVIKVAKQELLQECDYRREAESTRRFKLMLARYPESHPNPNPSPKPQPQP